MKLGDGDLVLSRDSFPKKCSQTVSLEGYIDTASDDAGSLLCAERGGESIWSWDELSDCFASLSLTPPPAVCSNTSLTPPRRPGRLPKLSLLNPPPTTSPLMRRGFVPPLPVLHYPLPRRQLCLIPLGYLHPHRRRPAQSPVPPRLSRLPHRRPTLYRCWRRSVPRIRE